MPFRPLCNAIQLLFCIMCTHRIISNVSTKIQKQMYVLQDHSRIYHQIKQKLEACPNAPVRPVLELCRGARMAKLLVEFTIILYFIKRQELVQRMNMWAQQQGFRFVVICLPLQCRLTLLPHQLSYFQECSRRNSNSAHNDTPNSQEAPGTPQTKPSQLK